MSFTEFFEEEPPVITIEPKVEPKADKKHHAKKAKTVSFSQYAMHKKCPHQWELAYLKKLHVYSDSIHTIFGTAVHDVLQKYIALLCWPTFSMYGNWVGFCYSSLGWVHGSKSELSTSTATLRIICPRVSTTRNLLFSRRSTPSLPASGPIRMRTRSPITR